MLKVTAVIPARYSSTRFPGKPLAIIQGKPMIQWVYEKVRKNQKIDRVIIATDDVRISNVVQKFGGEYAMTSPDHQNGTERIAEVALDIDSDIIINVQGDEPLVERGMLDKLIEPFEENHDLQMATLKTKLYDSELIRDPNVVKVVSNANQQAIYFSRNPIPYNRDGIENIAYFKHIGIYAYRKEFLLKYVSWKPTSLEMSESLEQLRALENGVSIHISEVSKDLISVDTPDDLRRVEEQGVLTV